MLELETVMTLVKEADKKPYGDVEYADPGYQEDKKKRYPMDTEAHIRSAWSYINQDKNASQYSAEEVKKIKAKIVAAWKREIDKDGPPSTQKSMGPDPDPVLDALIFPESQDAVATVQPPPMGYNSTGILMEFNVSNGQLSANRLCLNNYDYDVNGQEEAAGSEDEKREITHYAVVLDCVRAFLMHGEHPEIEGLTTTKDEGTNGEAEDDVDENGKPNDPKKKDLEVSFA